MKSIVLSIITICFLTLSTFITNAQVKSKIEKANKQGKAVFLVVTEPSVTNTKNAEIIANKAHEIYSKSIVITMDRSNAANKELLTKYRLSGAQLPLILVIASNGVVTGGFISNQATSEKIVALVPSPKKAEVLLALNNEKSVFVVVSNKSMSKNKEVISNCEQACEQMRDKAEVVNIDLDDINEQKFLEELKVNQKASQPQTYILNTKGQITGSLSGAVDVKTLVATATKKNSSCCPSGGSGSCSPK
jgi:hypothetical protein